MTETSIVRQIRGTALFSQVFQIWRVEPMATLHVVWSPSVIAIFTLFFEIFQFFFIQMIETYFKQYIYMHNVCCFNRLYLEFEKNQISETPPYYHGYSHRRHLVTRIQLLNIQ